MQQGRPVDGGGAGDGEADAAACGFLMRGDEALADAPAGRVVGGVCGAKDAVGDDEATDLDRCECMVVHVESPISREHLEAGATPV